MKTLYRFCRKVVTGTQLARKLGSPTLNFRTHNITFKKGVYASYVRLEGKSFPAVSYYGPKFGHKTLALETHILDPNCVMHFPYIYAVEVRFTHFIRPPIAFKNVGDLQSQIQADIKTARHLLQLT